jgi:hypothetical protein
VNDHNRTDRDAGEGSGLGQVNDQVARSVLIGLFGGFFQFRKVPQVL